ncbi:MAG: Holliday junction resolvase RuvX [Gammaproteobacteria bacterium]
MRGKKLICFDYGEKRIGVAVGQTLTATASPLETISVRNGKPDWHRISALIDQWRPQALIVGRPLCMDGSRQPLTNLTGKFVRQLKGRYHLPVHYEDERLSSYEARQRQKNRNDQLDAIAAQVILESWLAENTKITTSNAKMHGSYSPENE